MTSRTAVQITIVSLWAIALPMTVNCQEQEAVSRGMPLSYWMARLDNRSDLTSRSAIQEMGTNALPDLIRTLRQVQSNEDINRGRALDAITSLGLVGKSALPDILPLVTNQNPQLKIRALFALKAIRPDTQTVKPVLPALMETLRDGEWTMRLAAMNALAAVQPPLPQATSALVQLLNDSNELVRESALHSLVIQTNAIVLPMLDKQLHDTDSYIVTGAAAQIGNFGAAAAASESRLRELLNAPVLTVRQAATNALAAITGQSFSHSAPEEKADQTFNFSGIPFPSFLRFYEDLAGKKVTITVTPPPFRILRVQTVRPLTKSEALQCLEEVLKEQAGLVIVHGPDSSLTAVAR